MITNQALGELLQVDHSMASRLRSGDRLPSPATMRRIAVAFGVDEGKVLLAHGQGRSEFGKFLTQVIKEYEKRANEPPESNDHPAS